MNEAHLRQYVRRELLREYGVYMSAQDLYDIFDSIKDVWEVTKVAIKDVLSAAVYVYDVAVAVNGEEIAEARKQFNSRKEKIAGDYTGALKSVQDRMGKDFHMAAFLVAPGPYLLAQTYDKGPAITKDVVEFLADAGMDFELPRRSAVGEPEEIDATIRQTTADSLLGKKTSYKKADFTNVSGQIENALNKIFGVRSTTSEGVSSIRQLLKEEKEAVDFKKSLELAQKDVSKAIEEALKNFDTSNLVDPVDQKNYVELKQQEAKKYVEILNAPTKFVVAIGKAKTMADVRKATEFLKGTPYKLEGIGPEEEKKIAEQAKQFAKDAREKKKVEEVLKAAESKIPPDKVTDEELYDACVVVLTKNAIEKIAMVFNDPDKADESGKKLVEAINKYKKELLEEFMEGLTDEDLRIIEKTKEGKDLSQVMRDGSNAIRASGLRSKKSK